MSHACNRVLNLRGKRALVERRTAIDVHVGELRKILSDTSGAAGVVGGDPQACRLSDLTGLSFDRIELLLGILFGVVAELSSGLLLVIGMSGLWGTPPTARVRSCGTFFIRWV